MRFSVTNRFGIAILILCAIIAIVSFTYVSIDAGSDKQAAVHQRDVAELKSQSQPGLQAAQALQAPIADTDLPDKLTQLSDRVSKLDDEVRNLDQRVTRLQQTIPTGQKLAAKLEQLEPMRREGETARENYEKYRTTMRDLAAQFNVQLDDKVFADINVHTPLDSQPEFFKARSAAIQARRIFESIQVTYSATLVDGFAEK